MGIFAGSRRRGVWSGLDDERLAYNDRIDRLRKSEYPMLKGKQLYRMWQLVKVNTISRFDLS
jgi:hypothetical protein